MPTTGTIDRQLFPFRFALNDAATHAWSVNRISQAPFRPTLNVSNMSLDVSNAEQPGPCLADR